MNTINNENQALIIKFLDPFEDSVTRLLEYNLDKKICKNISFEMESAVETKDSENLKENNVIFITEYATGQNQGSFCLLLPEELVSKTAGILMRNKDAKEFDGIVSEAEISATTDLISKIFKDIENSFKHSYSRDLAFSSTPSILTKEMADFKINASSKIYNFVITYNLKLNKEAFNIILLLNLEDSTQLTMDLGLLKVNSSIKKMNVSSLDIDTISDVKINVTAELGRTRVPIKYALELVRGSIIELETLNNSDIKVFANGVEFAYAQVVAIEDNFGLKITKIISPKERLECI